VHIDKSVRELTYRTATTNSILRSWI